MGVYRYKHDWCGMEQEIFLKNEEKSSIGMPCYRCGRSITANLVRDKSIKTGSADGTTGILRRNAKNQNRRHSGK